MQTHIADSKSLTSTFDTYDALLFQCQVFNSLPWILTAGDCQCRPWGAAREGSRSRVPAILWEPWSEFPLQPGPDPPVNTYLEVNQKIESVLSLSLSNVFFTSLTSNYLSEEYSLPIPTTFALSQLQQVV